MHVRTGGVRTQSAGGYVVADGGRAERTNGKGRGTRVTRGASGEKALHTSTAARTQAPGTRGNARRRRCIGSCTPATPGTSHVVGLPSTAIHGGQLLLLCPQVVHLRLRSSRNSRRRPRPLSPVSGIPSSSLWSPSFSSSLSSL